MNMSSAAAATLEKPASAIANVNNETNLPFNLMIPPLSDS